MLKRIPIAASIFLLLTAATWAQDRSYMSTFNSAIRGQWMQFNIVAGRIHLESTRVGQVDTGPNTANRKDHLSIHPENGETSMTYDGLNSKEQFTINANDDFFVHLRLVPKNNPQAVAVEFTQKSRGKSILIIGTEDNQKVFAADSIWHLFLLYPEPARKHLAPLVQALQPNWKLAETAETIERELLRHGDAMPGFDRANWMRWVDQLGEEDFARRQAADRALRAADPALLVFLQQLDFNQLDPEQQFRLRRIIQAISEKMGNDSPEQVASWLAGDSAVWLALLNRPDVATRRIAAKQLAAVLEGPIPVDPAADPASQKTQLEQLSAQLEALSTREKK
jgi:hypothetical protein